MPAIFSLAALLTSVFLLISGNALVSLVVPLRASLVGFGDLTVGLLGSAYFFGMLVGALLAPTLVGRVGHIRAFAACMATVAAAVGLLPAIETPWAWIVSRAVLGFALAGVYAIIESWINGFATNRNRGSLYAVYQIVNFGASAVGQLLLRGLDPLTFVPFTIGAALSALSIIPLSMTTANAPQIPAAVRLKLAMFRKLAPIAVFGAFVAGACNGAVISLAPIYALRVGNDPQAVPLFTSAIVIGSALGVFPAGRLSDRIDRRIVIASVMGVGALLEAALALYSPTHLVLVLLGFLVGLTTYTLYTLIASLANDTAEARDMVAVSACLLFVYCVAAVLSPTFASEAMLVFGPQALFWQNGACHGALALFALMSLRSGTATVSFRPR